MESGMMTGDGAGGKFGCMVGGFRMNGCAILRRRACGHGQGRSSSCGWMTSGFQSSDGSLANSMMGSGSMAIGVVCFRFGCRVCHMLGSMVLGSVTRGLGLQGASRPALSSVMRRLRLDDARSPVLGGVMHGWLRTRG